MTCEVFYMKTFLLKFVLSATLVSLYTLYINLFNNLYIEMMSGLLICMIIMYISYINHQKSFFHKDEEVNEIVHDLKTPLTAQMRVSEYLIKGAFGELNETQKEIAIQLNNSSKLMLNIINNVLYSCKLKYNNQPIETQDFDINEIIRECISQLKYPSEDKRCKIIFDYSDEKIFVHADKTEIERVIINMLSNAVKYSHPDRIIMTEAKIKKNECSIGITSYGNLIEDKNLNKIFQKHNKISKTGTGLGLFICNKLLKKHKCKMIVKSNNKIGNYFGFNIALSVPPHFTNKRE